MRAYINKDYTQTCMRAYINTYMNTRSVPKTLFCYSTEHGCEVKGRHNVVYMYLFKCV